jgi:predicted CXXCH cytochrome family protein
MKKIAIAIGMIGIAIVVGILAFSASTPGETVASELEGTKSPATYIGVDQCASCHSSQYTKWLNTGHGKDFTDFDYHGSTMNLFLRYSPDPAQFLPGRCATCHVVGYNDTAQGGFDISQAYNSTHNSKFLGIQCENCHGPGSEHPAAADKAATIWGRPTVEQSCYGDLNSGCHGPSGHDNYYAHSSHNDSLGAAGGSVATNEDCQKCHTREGFINFVEGTTVAISNPNPVDCSACHDPHENNYEHQLRMPGDELCQACHNNGYETSPSADPHVHHPQAEMNLGEGGAVMTMGSGMAGVECIDCHMWTTPEVSRTPITDTIGGEEHHDHEFEPATEACADCHSSIMSTLPTEKKPTVDIDEGEANYTLWLEWEVFEEYWEREVDTWQKVIDSWQEDFEARWAEVNTTVSTIYADLVAANATGDVDQTSLDKAWDLYYDALWNLEFVKADGSKGVHNFNYAMALLDEAENNMESVAELITVMAADPPAEPTDYSTFFYIVIALLVISMLLSIVAIMRKPQEPGPKEPAESQPQEPPKEPEGPKEV